jgi:hypothetical protein
MANSTTLYKLPDGRMAVDVTEAKTLAIKDCGVVQNVIYDNAVITLPAAVVSYAYTIRNGGVKKTNGPTRSGDDGSVLITITPDGTEYISGCELASDASDLLKNTKATAKVGDEVSLIAAVATGWNVTDMKGIWANTAV